jgi:hypothetical protein
MVELRDWFSILMVTSGKPDLLKCGDKFYNDDRPCSDPTGEHPVSDAMLIFPKPKRDKRL